MRAVLGLGLILGGGTLGLLVVLGHIGPGAEKSTSKLLPKTPNTSEPGPSISAKSVVTLK